MSISACPDYTRIVYFLRGLVTEEESRRIKGHVLGCSQCQLSVREAKELINYVKEEASWQVPTQAHQKALNLFRNWNSTGQKAEAEPGGIKWLFGKLIMDSRTKGNFATQLTAGLRGAAPGSSDIPYQLLFTLEQGKLEVDLQLQQFSKEGYFTIIGQLVGFSGQEREVELTQVDGSLVAKVEADEAFTFRFPAVADGEYLLRIYDGEVAIELPVNF